MILSLGIQLRALQNSSPTSSLHSVTHSSTPQMSFCHFEVILSFTQSWHLNYLSFSSLYLLYLSNHQDFLYIKNSCIWAHLLAHFHPSLGCDYLMWGLLEHSLTQFPVSILCLLSAVPTVCYSRLHTVSYLLHPNNSKTHMLPMVMVFNLCSTDILYCCTNKAASFLFVLHMTFSVEDFIGT